MKTPENHYKTLDIGPDSSHEQIVQAAREIRIKVHPDQLKRVGGPTEEQERAINREAALVGQAAHVLSDPVLRRKYDMKLHTQFRAWRQRDGVLEGRDRAFSLFAGSCSVA